MKTCKQCGQSFLKVSGKSIYCIECTYKRKKQKESNRRPEKEGLAPTLRLRFKILYRDHFTCQYCGRNPTEDNVKLEVDHVKPISNGGLDSMDNLITACRDCNQGKSDLILTLHALFKQKQ
jgi:5-methylcytosine-specific restriction endonuclease McrA